jgi:helix-turn-helix protein
MSWSALTWATDSDVGSLPAKFILILLANKADENFSCYPSIRTLMAEASAGRSTVLRALKDLEARGFISRHPQYHDSGARRSTRYYLNHPLAPHTPRPDPEPPRPGLRPPSPNSKQPQSRYGTGTVSKQHPPGGPQRDPLNPLTESPSKPSDAAAEVLVAIAEAWNLSIHEVLGLLSAVESALAEGWPTADLIDHLVQNPNGVREPVRVRDPRPASVPWCGECEDEHSRTITVVEADGSAAARFCTRCSPQVHRPRPSADRSLQHTKRW